MLYLGLQQKHPRLQGGIQLSSCTPVATACPKKCAACNTSGSVLHSGPACKSCQGTSACVLLHYVSKTWNHKRHAQARNTPHTQAATPGDAALLYIHTVWVRAKRDELSNRLSCRKPDTVASAAYTASMAAPPPGRLLTTSYGFSLVQVGGQVAAAARLLAG